MVWIQIDGSHGKRHEQIVRSTRELGGTGGEHAVTQVHQDPFAGAAAARADKGGQAEDCLRDPKPEGHVRVVLSLL